jgi:hypothetical protein
MSSDTDGRRQRHCQRQRAYLRRFRAGLAIYSIPLGGAEIDALIGLGWLPEDDALDRNRVSEAVGRLLHEALRARL